MTCYEGIIDDYQAYCESELEAQAFILGLTRALAKYNLALNPQKTAILPLPRTPVDSWITDLLLALPTNHHSTVSTSRATQYLNLAIRLDKQTPGGSVLKYALKALMAQDLDIDALSKVLRYALNLSFFQPSLLPLLHKPMDTLSSHGAFGYRDELRTLVREHSRLGHSDAVSWALYYCQQYGVDIGDDIADAVILSRDCIPILFLYLLENSTHQSKVLSFVSTDLDRDDLYELDRYWLLFYQLFLDHRIDNPYSNDDAFDVLSNEGVDFVGKSQDVIPLHLGQWLIENVPRGTNLSTLDRGSDRELPFTDSQEQ